MDSDYRKKWIDELEKLKENDKQGVIIGVEVIKPKPWQPAARMIKLYSDGVDIKAIAKQTGYSVPTVERNLKTKGEDLRTGPRCEKYLGKVFSVNKALSLMPIPCGSNCVCSWRPIFHND